jgi:ribosomal protein L35
LSWLLFFFFFFLYVFGMFFFHFFIFLLFPHTYTPRLSNYMQRRARHVDRASREAAALRAAISAREKLHRAHMAEERRIAREETERLVREKTLDRHAAERRHAETMAELRETEQVEHAERIVQMRALSDSIRAMERENRADNDERIRGAREKLRHLSEIAPIDGDAHEILADLIIERARPLGIAMRSARADAGGAL